MSIHSSLRGGDTLKGERSVLTRQERIAALKKTGKFKEEERSVYGLPKVRTKFKVAGAKKKAAKEAVPGAPGGTVAAGAAAPAAGAKGAAAKPAAAAAGKGAAPAAKGAAAPAAAKKGDKK